MNEIASGVYYELEGRFLITLRKLMAFLCVVAVLWAALSPASSGLFWAVLVPLLLLIAVLALALADRLPEMNVIPRRLFFSALASRAPPLADTLI